MIKRRVAYAIATCCGLGYVACAPGSLASLVTIVALFFMPPLPVAINLLLYSALLVGALWSSDLVARFSRNSDPSYVVIDEVVGMALALVSVPAVWWMYTIAFVAFRFFDIYKPFPVAYVEKKFSGGIGIVADDIVAGIMARGVIGVVVMWVVY